MPISSHLIVKENKTENETRKQNQEIKWDLVLFSTPWASASVFPPPWEHPSPAHWWLCVCVRRAETKSCSHLGCGQAYGTEVVRRRICFCTAGLLALPLTGMALLVNNLLLSDEKQNHRSRDQNTAQPVLMGQFACSDSVLFSVSHLFTVLSFICHVVSFSHTAPTSLCICFSHAHSLYILLSHSIIMFGTP